MTVAAAILAWATVPVLVLTIAVRVRRGSHGVRSMVKASPVRDAVLASAVVAAIAAAWLGVPFGGTWPVLATAACTAVLLWQDERFWVAAAALVAFCGVVGALILAGLAGSYEQVDGPAMYLGARQLVAWGGVGANPGTPGWVGTLGVLAVLRYAIPAGLAFAVSWVLATRAAMTGLERVALMLAAGSLLAGMLAGPLIAFFFLSTGVLMGVPVALGLAALVGCVVLLATLGPGTIESLIMSGRTLASRVPLPGRDAYTLVTTVGAVGDARTGIPAVPDEPVLRSVGAFATRHIRGLKRRYRVLVGILGFFTILGLFGYGCTPRVQDMRPVHFEPVSEQVALPFEVRSAAAGPGGSVWLVGENGEVAWLNVAEHRRRDLDIRATGATADADDLLVLTDENVPRVVGVAADGTETDVVTLPEGTAGALGADATELVVSGIDGVLRRFDRASGALLAETIAEPADDVVVLNGEVWTLRRNPERAWNDSYHLATRRARDTLAPITGEGNDQFIGDVAAIGDRTWFTLVSAVGTNPGRSQLDLEQSIGGAGFRRWDGRILGPDGDDGVWVAFPYGRAHRVTPDGPGARHDVHYDTIHAVVPTEGATWLVVSDDLGTVVDTTDARSYLVRVAAW